MLRHAGTEEATIWVQTDGPCEVEVRPRGGAAASERTFSVEGHHYALVHVEGLPSDTATPYEVALDGEIVWPEPDSHFPPSVLRTHAKDEQARIFFGSCRVAAPHEPPHTLRKDQHPEGREVDALRGLALRMCDTPPEEWPHALLLLGDQVYADEVHPAVERQIEGEEVITLRRLREALHRRVGRAGDPLAALDRPQRDDLRRPRRPRRLEHVDRMGHRDAHEGVVAQAHPRRLRELSDLPAPREPLAERARRLRPLRAAAHRPGPDAAAARVRARRPTRRSRGRAGASAATSGRPAW